jgi:hypothetical protein
MLKRWDFSFIAASLMLMASANPCRAQVTMQPPAGQSGSLDLWRKSMIRTPLPKHGCFHASYPSTEWMEVPCVTAPPPNGSARGTRPATVGGGRDFVAQVPGPIYLAQGSFTSVTGVTSETGSDNFGTDAFGLQLNSNSGFPAGQYCSGCTGWEQFVFTNFPGNQNSSGVYIQYWLFNAQSCPPLRGSTSRAPPERPRAAISVVR